MKVTAAATLLFATLVLASPAPIAQPEAEAAPAAAQPLLETREEAYHALPERDVEAVAARYVQLEARKKKPKPASSGNSTASAADIITPSRALQLGAVGVGVMEVVRLWV